MKKITPIAMKCNQEQFEAIKPKLKGIEIGCISNFNEWNYLVNNADGNLGIVCNTGKSGSNRYNREIHETWNERIFLEACGIETEETYQITKDQILKLENGFTTENLYKWFPEAFEVKLEVGKWYKRIWRDGDIDLFFISDFIDNYFISSEFFRNNERLEEGIGYRFGNKNKKDERYSEIEATQQEVFESLKKEAVNRGFVEGASYKNTKGNIYVVEGLKEYSSYDLISKDGDGMIFKNGTWATIIETKTKEEAEKLLNCKIV